MRIIGGKHRGRILAYTGDPATRPMKDRVREAAFNLLGPAVKQTHALDLFAGTGAIGLEAISRGAASATFFERSHAAAKIIDQNIQMLELQGQCRVIVSDTLAWLQRNELRRQSVSPALQTDEQVTPSPAIIPADIPWCVFVSPPWELFETRREELLDAILQFQQAAPHGSLITVEADQRLDPAELPEADAWDVRHYPPAVICIWEQPRGQ